MSQTQIPPSAGTAHTPPADLPLNAPEASGSRQSRIVTALSGLATAIATVIFTVIHVMGAGGGPSAPAPPPPTQTPAPTAAALTQPPAPAPAATATAGTYSSPQASSVFSGHPTQQVASGEDTIINEWSQTLDQQTTAIAGRCANGSEGDCRQLIGTLLDECTAGEPLSCDMLYIASPSGSDLETYGNTCGGRVSRNNDQWCRDLAA
jgi:hypothetical protein